ncbi:hypothetical protein JEK36_22500 [Klebsiella pneumoniae]|nr:hypothetical protein [Klebsiella pneumoniae]
MTLLNGSNSIGALNAFCVKYQLLIFLFLPLMTGTREPRIRLAVFFLLSFSSSPGQRFAFLHADARFHGADGGCIPLLPVAGF